MIGCDDIRPRATRKGFKMTANKRMIYTSEKHNYKLQSPDGRWQHKRGYISVKQTTTISTVDQYHKFQNQTQ